MTRAAKARGARNERLMQAPRSTTATAAPPRRRARPSRSLGMRQGVAPVALSETCCAILLDRSEAFGDSARNTTTSASSTSRCRPGSPRDTNESQWKWFPGSVARDNAITKKRAHRVGSCHHQPFLTSLMALIVAPARFVITTVSFPFFAPIGMVTTIF